MNYHMITSDKNPKIKELVRFYESRYRKKEKKFVVEGKREIQLALDAAYELQSLFISEDLVDVFKVDPCHILKVETKVLKKISIRGGSEKCIAVFNNKETKPIEVKKKGRYLIIEEAEKPGNIGAILRTAEAAAVDGVFLSQNIELYNHNLIRSSLGAVFHLAVENSSLKDCQKKLEQQGIPIYATSPYAKVDYREVDLSKGHAWLMGSEKDGISETAKQIATTTVKLPILGKVDSLNLSAASAILIYEGLKK